MTEYIFCSPDQATLARVATQVGCFDTNTQQVITSGWLAPDVAWFLNIVGQVFQPSATTTTTDQRGNTVPGMVPLSGVWGRLRVIGDGIDVPSILAACRAAGMTVFEFKPLVTNGQSVWTSDGVAAAPDYVGSIGIIA
jgi:hypothetical protein